MDELTVPHPETQYLNMLSRVSRRVRTRETRNDSATKSMFGAQMFFDLADGFPLLTTKKVHWKSVIGELLWFLRGETNVKSLQEMGVSIWDEWADPVTGELGPIYGKQWRSWEGGNDETYDQLSKVIHDLKTNPYGRRHLVSAWNPADIDDMALPPCHCLFQFYVGDDERLHLQLYQRSADIFLGVPFNIASYAALLMIVAAMIGREAGQFVHTFGDYHIYSNHMDAITEQLSRTPRYFPQLVIEKDLRGSGVEVFDTLVPEDFHIVNYNPHPAIKAEVSR